MSVGNRDRPPDQAHRTKIVDVVAQVRRTVSGNLVCRKPFQHHLALVLDVVHRLDAQLGRTGLDDWVDLLGDDE